jgi:hypothetical protein
MAIAVFGFLYFDLNKKIEVLGPVSFYPTPLPSLGPGDLLVPSDCSNCVTIDDVNKMIAKAIATVSGSLSTGHETSSTNPTSTPKPHTPIFLPLGGSYSTQEMDWVDVPNAQISFDLDADYGSGAKVTWEAFLKLYQGNGTVYARLMDVTHGTAVDGSEIQTNSPNIVQVSSADLKFFGGRNVYRVQIKSSNGYTAYFDSGRIKINY